VRLRPLTEAECYARCYGGRREESVELVWVEPQRDPEQESREARRAEAAEGREAA
jgi:hypothetical protein